MITYARAHAISILHASAVPAAILRTTCYTVSSQPTHTVVNPETNGSERIGHLILLYKDDLDRTVNLQSRGLLHVKVHAGNIGNLKVENSRYTFGLFGA